MKILIADLQRTRRINHAGLRKLTRWLMSKATAMNPARTWVECSVAVVDHQRMIHLNRRLLDHEGTTDVITLAYPTAPGEHPSGWRGEIVINIEEAVEVSAGGHGDLNRELALYLAHGCQHLGGADDANPAEQKAMNRRQNRWLREAERTGLLAITKP